MNKIDRDRQRHKIRVKLLKKEQIIEARLKGGTLHKQTVAETYKLKKALGLIK
jgi:hypothetical protein